MGSGSRLALLVQNSFRRISSTSYPHQAQQNKLLSSADHGAEYNLFEADLATRVQQLQLHSGGTSGSAHLNWLLDAFSSTLATYASLPPLLLSCPSSSQDSDASGHAPNYSQYVIAAQRADETLSLLDACASLKHTADDADRQLGRLQQTLQSTEQALRAPHVSRAQVQTAAHRLRAAACRLDVAMGSSVQQHKEEARAALLLAAKSVQSAPHGSDPANQALDGTLLITLLTLASALSGFTSPTKCGAIRSACKLLVRYCSKSSSSSRAAAAWVTPFRQLQRDLRQEEMGSVFVELQALHASVISLLAALDMSTPDPQDINVEVVRRGVESLRKRAQEAGACLTRLRSQLASLFQALLTLRLALLHS